MIVIVLSIIYNGGFLFPFEVVRFQRLSFAFFVFLFVVFLLLEGWGILCAVGMHPSVHCFS